MKHLLLSVITFLSTASFAQTTTAPTKLPIIPHPSEIEAVEAAPFATGRPVAVSVATDIDERAIGIANDFARHTLGCQNPDIDASAHLILTNSPAMGPEAYSLKVRPDTIAIEASAPAGFFYAFQTLNQLHGSSPDGSIAAVDIADTPRMEWRGFMLDEGRHFFGKEEIKRIIDLMALYKFNRLHWHLTEDQGWRLEIKKWPKLTEVGAWRDSEKIGWKEAAPEPLPQPYGGFYTNDDIREIVEYARNRFIEILPEIDMPGHTRAMIAAYPEILACDPKNEHTVWDYAGVTDDVMNVASPKALQLTKDVIDEIIELFPYPYIHLGGDECPTTKWALNKQCRNRLKKIGSENYRDLQLDFYRQLETYINSKPQEQRRKLVFWNETLHGNTSMLSDSITIMSWIGNQEAERDGRLAAERGYDVIMTPQIPYYINRRQSTDPREPQTQGEGTETLEKVYNYMPLHDVTFSLLPKYRGIQANCWSEFIPDATTLEYMILPRLTAVAEAAWTPEYLRDFNNYRARLQGHKKIYQAKGYNFAPYEFE